MFPHSACYSSCVNSTSHTFSAAHKTSDGTNCGLGRAKAARIESPDSDPGFLKEQETKGLIQGERD